MKKILFFILISSITWAQTTYGPDTASYKREVFKTGNNKPNSYGLSYNNNLVRLGNDGYTKYRLFYQWLIPDNIIPDNSDIDSIEIFFIYVPYVSNYYLALRYYDVGLDIVNPNMDSLWSRTDGLNYIGEGQGFKYGYQGTQ